MIRQPSFSEIEILAKAKRTRRAQFLDDMNAIVSSVKGGWREVESLNANSFRLSLSKQLKQFLQCFQVR